MAHWELLKQAIDDVITTNGNNEITGAILNATLDQMVNDLGDYQFKGVATPTTNPDTPDGVAWYIAAEAGAYPNFGGNVLNTGSIGFFKWNGTWILEQLTGVVGETQLVKKYVDLAAEEIYIAPAKSLLTNIIVKGKTSTTTISVGSTSGGQDISRAKTVATGAFLTVAKSKVYENAANLYLNVTGGTCDVTLIFTTGVLI